MFGTWKAAVRTVDKTRSPAVVTVTPDGDPPKNNWSLGAGSDTPPAGLTNEGFGSEVRWNLSDLRDKNGNPLVPGNLYRFQFMVHDGDQNKVGGDTGQACVSVRMPPASTFSSAQKDPGQVGPGRDSHASEAEERRGGWNAAVLSLALQFSRVLACLALI